MKNMKESIFHGAHIEPLLKYPQIDSRLGHPIIRPYIEILTELVAFHIEFNVFWAIMETDWSEDAE